jgi:hypothetical protein
MRNSGRMIVEAMVLTVLLVSTAAAETPVLAEPRPCQEELEKLCSSARPGAGGIVSCLEEHGAELSEACRGRVQNALMRREEAKQACSAEIRRFCPDVTPGGRRLIKCLSLHVEELSPQCRQQAIGIRKPVEKANAIP